VCFFFFRQKTAYDISPLLVGSEWFIRAVATTAHYMAVASSFFQYVIDKADINGGGVEVSLFMDARGAVRRNPFRNRAVQRPKVNPYGKAVSLTPVQVQAFFQAIQEEPRPLVRARDNALFLAYLLTGRRASEIVVMQWGDIQPGDKPNTWQFRYIGKGHGKERAEDADWQWQPLPTPCYHAIVGWLKLAGRLEGITDGTYIFGPINSEAKNYGSGMPENCPLYTSDAADDPLCVDLGGCRIPKKKNRINQSN